MCELEVCTHITFTFDYELNLCRSEEHRWITNVHVLTTPLTYISLRLSAGPKGALYLLFAG